MVIVGVVYWVLVVPAHAAGGVALPISNWILHTAGPVLVALDWLLVRDRRAVPWSTLRWILGYPIVWLVVVLIRGATDGWVPYLFLDPNLGYGTVMIYVVLITVTFVAVGALVVWWGRRRTAPPDA